MWHESVIFIVTNCTILSFKGPCDCGGLIENILKNDGYVMRREGWVKDEFEFELEFDRFELDFDEIDDLVSY